MTRLAGWAQTSWIMLLAVALLLASFVAIAGSPQKVSAADPECKLLIMMDKSSSVGTNWPDFAAQVKALFTYDLDTVVPGLKVAFWTFSHKDNTEIAASRNFNDPFHDYIGINPLTSEYNSFSNTLDSVSPTGRTNYEQGFGYHNGLKNQDPDIQRMMSEVNVIAFLTDGEPNFPGNGLNGPDNPESITKGKEARDRYVDAAGNKLPVIAGFINPQTSTATNTLRDAINDPGDPDDNIGPLTGFDSSIYQFLRNRIPAACNATPPTNTYQLVPQVGIDGAGNMLTNGDEVVFTNSVERQGEGGGNSGWQMVNVTLEPGVSPGLLTFPRSSPPCTTSGVSYCDNRPADICAFIKSTISDKGECVLGASGSQAFSQALTSLPNNSVVVGDLEPGSRICSLLLLARPVATGATNRLSSIQCILIGKVPTVDVWGGDMRVGKRFVDDTSLLPTSGIYTKGYALRGSAFPGGRQYGSWVEYGALAPGVISGVASLSGYSRGFDRAALTGSSACQSQTNVLTFANAIDTATPAMNCGEYPSGSGYVPDVVSALTVFPAQPSTPATLRFDGSSPDAGDKPVLYRANSDVAIEASTIPGGKSFVVYAPTSTVTITGPITYEDEDRGPGNVPRPYTNPLQMPQLVIIARNINILDGVGRVDAWLIAPGQSDGQGIVNTCVAANGRTPATLSAAICNGTLRINGPIVARELQVWRTTVFNGKCEINNPGDIENQGHCSNSGPAETINLPGSSLLWAQALGTNSARVQTTHTTELPPYF